MLQNNIYNTQYKQNFWLTNPKISMRIYTQYSTSKYVVMDSMENNKLALMKIMSKEITWPEYIWNNFMLARTWTTRHVGTYALTNEYVINLMGLTFPMFVPKCAYRVYLYYKNSAHIKWCWQLIVIKFHGVVLNQGDFEGMIKFNESQH